MKDSLSPVLFGGKFEMLKAAQADDKPHAQVSIQPVEEQKEGAGEIAPGLMRAPSQATASVEEIQKEIKMDLGFKYLDVVCGSQ